LRFNLADYRRVYRSNQRSDRHDQNDAGFSPSDRLRMES